MSERGDRKPAGMRGPSLLIGLLVYQLAGGNVGAEPSFRPGVRHAQGATSWPADTVREEKLLASLRAAQWSFEKIRRLHLRRVPYVSGSCDHVIGRFCIWHETEDWEPPPEAPPVTQGRRELLARLDEASHRLRANGWISGQRVRYRVDAGDPFGAATAAAECRSTEPGWCAELAGFAFHSAGDFARADSAFQTASAALSPEERCEWNDLRRLLEGRSRKVYRKLDCEAREAFEARFWWLADPLFLVPGNERRTEHYWRRVMDRLQDRAASGFGLKWAEDLREILIRYGWPAGWEATWGRPGIVRGESHIVAHDPPGVRQFLPVGSWLESSRAAAEIPEKAWKLNVRQVHSYFSHPLAREFGKLEHQAARFRRGDTAVVVVAFDASVDTLPACDSMERALTLSRGPAGPTVVTRGSGKGDQAVITASLPGAPQGVLLGIEALCRSQRRASRIRYGLELDGPGSGFAVSDLLLGRELSGHQVGAELAATLEPAAAGARASLELKRGERVPVYWEVYGVPEGETVTVALGLIRARRGALKKMADRSRLTRGQPSASLRWKERFPEAGVWRRSVMFVVPEELSKGVYLLELVVKLSGAPTLRSSRIVEVEGR